jgi:hypothetical protein
MHMPKIVFKILYKNIILQVYLLGANCLNRLSRSSKPFKL